MRVNIKIDENQDFKEKIIKRIQQELHQVLKGDLRNIIGEKINWKLKDKLERYSNREIENMVITQIGNFVEERIRKILGGDSYWSNVGIDKYIEEYLDKKINQKLAELLKKKFGIEEGHS